MTPNQGILDNLDETEIELLEAGHGDLDRERETGRRADDLYQWGVVLPGEDEAGLVETIGDMDISYALALRPWTNTTFTGSKEDLKKLRARIAGEEE